MPELDEIVASRKKPNFRGQYILKIISLVRLRKEISLDNLVAELSCNAPYMSPQTAKQLVQDLQGGDKPKLVRGGESYDIIRLHKRKDDEESESLSD